MRDYILLYYNFCLISEGSEDIATKTLKTVIFDQPPLLDTPPENSTNSPLKLILPETRITEMHFYADIPSF